MEYYEAVYLKASGKRLNTQVNIRIVAGETVVLMEKVRFTSFQKALEYLRRIATTVVNDPSEGSETL